MASPGNQGAPKLDSPQAPTIPNLRDCLPKLEPRRRRPQQSDTLPVPENPGLPDPPDLSHTAFKIPTRRILSPKDHELFLASPTFNLIVGWIFTLSDSVSDTPISAVKDTDLSPNVRAILSILNQTETICRDSPPDDQGGSRFGNKTFRLFLDKVKARAGGWHTATLGVGDAAAAAEAATYLNHSFGNRTRIDYGSGHELNFMIWLLCLYQLRVLRRSDFPALVLRVFARYLEVMRLVQMNYYLEPAGSHGVWGLDDYQFLPFLFGASQLLHHKFITPLAIHQQLTLEEFGGEYLYLGQVNFVNETKTVKGLRWHSPMLDDISAAKSWGKIEGGMRRMFVAEVLRKLPVMQHFLFGSLVPAVEGMSEMDGIEGRGEEEDDEVGEVEVFDEGGVRHVHQQSVGWGDCCGIKVPSSLAAAQEARKRGEQLRRIPFD
ncbi:Serine/threonine-protein phosphatase 2A activator [Coniochaeta hoffmannii]|uniref:Serine/threonine-protein phosphatase 2A activator n=1 Tax=Coniochaeta hoffmannii TaxID=91930 RepID=A0AA38RSH1_9PEZI|nr:Serine/threonine-protein phosphatase 2A activator [Coniochaeta hoffmannii]